MSNTQAVQLLRVERDSHLVTVEVSVECMTNKWMKLQCLSIYKYWLKCLESKTVECRSSVEHYRMLFYYIIEDAPYFWSPLFDHSFCLLDVWSCSIVVESSDKEWLKEFQCHERRNTTLVHLQFWSDDDYRTTRVVNTLTKKVLSESTLLTLKLVCKRLKISLRSTLSRIFDLTIVQEAIDSFLKHSLLVSDNNVWSLNRNQTLKTVISIDDSSIEFVKVSCSKSTTIELNHRSEVWWNYRKNCEDHPFRPVT